jgi:chromosome segregation ATPase
MDVAKQTPNYADKAAVLDALGRNAAYWTMGLVHVVEILKKDIGQLENSMKQSSACRDDEIDRLQQILGQVTKANAEAAKNMKHAKSELEYENTCLKNQLKKLTQENMMYEERIETLTTDNNHLNKDLDLLQENLKNENTALKQDVKKLREDAFSYKKQMIELFDDNVRLTHEVNRLTERLDQITQNMKGDGLDRNGNTNIGDIFHCG